MEVYNFCLKKNGYETIRTLLEKWNLSGSPKTCGLGWETYVSDDRFTIMLVDWVSDSAEIREGKKA